MKNSLVKVADFNNADSRIQILKKTIAAQEKVIRLLEQKIEALEHEIQKRPDIQYNVYKMTK